jgi:hypothetical protein
MGDFQFRCGWFLGPDEGQCRGQGVSAHYVMVYPPAMDAEPEPRALMLCEAHGGSWGGHQGVPRDPEA